MTSPALRFLDAMERRRLEWQQDPARLAELQGLQHWQAERLERTYTDLASQPRYRAAVRFFLQDLYGPHDFTQRNRDLKKVLAPWEQRLPPMAYQAVLFALELENLTQELDISMVNALQGRAVTPAAYAAAYRQVGERVRRQRQIWLVVAAGRALDALVQLPMIGTALRLARLPARLTGVRVLHEFLERGHAAFRHMGGAQELLRSIEQRETAIMQQLFAGARDPLGPTAPERTQRCS